MGWPPPYQASAVFSGSSSLSAPSTLPQLCSTDGADDDSSDVPCGTSSRGVSRLTIHTVRTWQALLSAVTSYQTTGSVDPPGLSATALGSEYGPQLLPTLAQVCFESKRKIWGLRLLPWMSLLDQIWFVQLSHTGNVLEVEPLGVQ